MDVIFYDEFENSYVSERDEYAPPERYISTYRGINDFREVWKVSGNPQGDRLGIVFSADEYYTPIAQMKRSSIAENYKCQLDRLLYMSVPTEVFDYYLERVNLH